MKLKNLEELKETNLKGYCYYVPAWGMSMTSRHSYDPELWIVLEDDGNECVVAEYKNQSWTKKFSKERTALLIVDYPAINGTTFTNLIK